MGLLFVKHPWISPQAFLAILKHLWIKLFPSCSFTTCRLLQHRSPINADGYTALPVCSCHTAPLLPWLQALIPNKMSVISFNKKFLPIVGVLANVYWQLLVFKFQPFFDLVFANQSETLKVISCLRKKKKKAKKKKNKSISIRKGKTELDAVENIMNIQQMLFGAYLQKRKSAQKSLINGLINKPQKL